MTGESRYARWKHHEAALRRGLEEEQRTRPSRIVLPHVHMVDIHGLFVEKDGVDQKVGHWAKCEFPGCGWSAQRHIGELEAAWAAAKADRDEHLREVLRARRHHR